MPGCHRPEAAEHSPLLGCAFEHIVSVICIPYHSESPGQRTG